jgi:hypothetical protein
MPKICNLCKVNYNQCPKVDLLNVGLDFCTYCEPLEYYVFTYSMSGQDYSGGHVKIYARDHSEARQLYSQLFEVGSGGCLKFAFQYSEEEWVAMPAFIKGFNTYCNATFDKRGNRI